MTQVERVRGRYRCLVIVRVGRIEFVCVVVSEGGGGGGGGGVGVRR